MGYEARARTSEACSELTNIREGSHSGRVRIVGNDVGSQDPRGFDSLSLRHDIYAK